MTRRRRCVVVPLQTSIAHALEVKLRHELGLAPIEQLELGNLLASSAGSAAAPIASSVTLVTSPPCKACGRWNYHLIDCAEVSP